MFGGSHSVPVKPGFWNLFLAVFSSVSAHSRDALKNEPLENPKPAIFASKAPPPNMHLATEYNVGIENVQGDQIWTFLNVLKPSERTYNNVCLQI